LRGRAGAAGKVLPGRAGHARSRRRERRETEGIPALRHLARALHSKGELVNLAGWPQIAHRRAEEGRMGIYGALGTAVAGIRAQSYALENISGNIANSQTVGYKRTDTFFNELVTASHPRKQDAAGVSASSRATNALQGDLLDGGSPTFMAVTGDGFFVVGEKRGEVDGRPVLDTVDLYTRRGDFELDKDGYLVNGAGYYLKALPIDRQTGNVSGGAPEYVRIENGLLPAQVTSRVDYAANLPSYPLTADTDPSQPNSELLDVAAFMAPTNPNPNDPTTAGTGVVQGEDEKLFLDNSVAGGALTAYSAGGTPVNVQLRWAKISTGPDNWNLFYLENSAATGAAPMWRNVGVDYTFDDAGRLTSGSQVNIANLTVDGVSVGPVQINHGAGGLTQFGDPGGAVKVTELTQNGYAAAELSSVAVSDGGRVVAAYANGKTVNIGQVVLANFNAPSMLQKREGGAFASSKESGNAILGGGGTIVGGALEGSNTEIADEFSKLIITQQAYSANSRIVTTADEMMSEVLNMVR
jgi:flagellar hook protein FlgE